MNPREELIEAVRGLIDDYNKWPPSEAQLKLHIQWLSHALTAAEEWEKGVEPVRHLVGHYCGPVYLYKCPKCDRTLSPRQKFCGECSVRLNWPEEKK